MLQMGFPEPSGLAGGLPGGHFSDMWCYSTWLSSVSEEHEKTLHDPRDQAALPGSTLLRRPGIESGLKSPSVHGLAAVPKHKAPSQAWDPGGHVGLQRGCDGTQKRTWVGSHTSVLLPGPHSSSLASGSFKMQVSDVGGLESGAFSLRFTDRRSKAL